MEKQIEFNDITLCTQSFGKANNPAILLIMGATCSLIWWETKFCETLASKGFFVVRYDNRDTGKSTCYPVGESHYNFEELADDAIKVLDAYDIKKAVIMGMSLGGMLAQIIGVKYPNRLSGLVLHATMYFAEGAENLPYSSDDVNEFFATFGSFEPKTFDELIEYALKQWQVTSKSNRPKDKEHVRNLMVLDIKRSNNYASRVNHSYVQIAGDELTKIVQISVPTLVIHGTLDAVIPYPHGQMLAKTIPNANLLTLDGAGHELHTQDYEKMIMKIADMFLN